MLEPGGNYQAKIIIMPINTSKIHKLVDCKSKDEKSLRLAAGHPENVNLQLIFEISACVRIKQSRYNVLISQL